MLSTMPLVSIVVPCYNEDEALPFFVKKITETANEMPQVDFEYVFVDDGSQDNTLACLRRLHEKNSAFRYVSFSRNFGKEAAMLAGLEAATGDYIVIIDADLQDSPELIPEMYEIVAGGEYDCVATRRTSR
ncbi:MAG: glycosyltransferase family 2 protein, partial [Defluviitaleaceae bacterium]|nr:glycosyltransferase family 2 protein [Defluviitaleaceae bacterium]